MGAPQRAGSIRRALPGRAGDDAWERLFSPCPGENPRGKQGAQIPRGKCLVGQKGLPSNHRGLFVKGPLVLSGLEVRA